MRPRFHLAFPVDDLGRARTFYREVLGCAEGRSSDRWVDFDLYGHQIVAHQVEGATAVAGRNPVDGHGVPVPHFGRARTFYREVLGCAEGRSSDRWVDFDLYGHQIVAHQVEGATAVAGRNPVDGHGVPVPHFGLILEWEAFHVLADRLRAHGVHFEIEPYIRFAGQVGEQATMFLLDPSGNALEFKAFRDDSQVFAT